MDGVSLIILVILGLFGVLWLHGEWQGGGNTYKASITKKKKLTPNTIFEKSSGDTLTKNPSTSIVKNQQESILLDIARAFENGRININPWRYENGKNIKCTIDQCDAVWVRAKKSDKQQSDKYSCLSGPEALLLAKVLQQKFKLNGGVTISKSGKSWNIWRISKVNRDTHRLSAQEKFRIGYHQNLDDEEERRAFPEDFNRSDDMVYIDGEWYHEDHL
ncbi:MAG: hypothetical protein HQ521_20445 [Bacteroidetes bacterium]|nr:hypothetical protein [Bacteroidota bacterium]